MSKPTDKNYFMSESFLEDAKNSVREAVEKAHSLGLPAAYIETSPLPDIPITRTIYLGRKKKISEEGRQKRIEAINFARGSVRLEGYVLSEEVEKINARYIAGELSSDEHTAAVLALNNAGNRKNQ